MVHNGIEYGDMQLIAEVYDILKNVLNMTNEEMANVFDDWNTGELNSYLIEITSKILRKRSEDEEGYVVDCILDKTGMKGTGTWTVKEGADLGVAIPTIAAALYARSLSARKEERLEASEKLESPKLPEINKDEVVNDLKAALYASKICSYAQGLSLIKTASDQHEWDIDLAECARLWMGGCIIRAGLLNDIHKAFASDDNLKNLLVADNIAPELNDRSMPWRRVVSLCFLSGIACPALANSLAYYDTYRRANLPASLTQAQRDYFGGHTYERKDKDGHFHTAWTDAHKDIGDINKRTAGEQLQT
jgi:6-phosphogluconate dehydrogenase